MVTWTPLCRPRTYVMEFNAFTPKDVCNHIKFFQANEDSENPQKIHSTSSVDFIRSTGGSLSAIDCRCYSHAKGACKQCLRKLPFFRSQKLCRR